MKKIIVIGATAAGMSFSAKLKRLSPEIVLSIYEKRAYPSLGACGLPYYVGGLINDVNQLIARSKAQFEKEGIMISTDHEVIEILTEQKLVVIKNLITNELFNDHYDALIMATGASPIMSEVFKVDHPNVINLHSLEDGEVLRCALENPDIKNVAIVGGGYIGLELAENIHHYDKQVHIIDLAHHLLEKTFDIECSTMVLDKLQEKQIKIHLNSKIDKIVIEEDHLKGLVVNSQLIEADLIVVSIGVKPNSQLLKMADKLDNGALVIDDFGETSIKDIYAIGDCAIVKHQLKGNSYIPLATSANKYGRQLATIISGQRKPLPKVLGAACLKLFDLELARVGLTQKEAEDLGLETKATVLEDLNHPSYYPNASSIKLKVIYDQKTRLILGAQAVGRHDCIAKIDVLALAISQEIKIDDLVMMDFPYAPPFSRTWHMINTMANISK